VSSTKHPDQAIETRSRPTHISLRKPHYWKPVTHPPLETTQQREHHGLLRQYFPKGTDLSLHSQVDLDKVAARLNDRPRETLDWLKPIEVFDELVANHVSP
jgi:IS30 family transposase